MSEERVQREVARRPLQHVAVVGNTPPTTTVGTIVNLSRKNRPHCDSLLPTLLVALTVFEELVAQSEARESVVGVAGGAVARDCRQRSTASCWRPSRGSLAETACLATMESPSPVAKRQWSSVAVYPHRRTQRLGTQLIAALRLWTGLIHVVRPTTRRTAHEHLADQRAASGASRVLDGNSSTCVRKSRKNKFPRTTWLHRRQ